MPRSIELPLDEGTLRSSFEVAASDAGATIMSLFGDVSSALKADESPVTQADRAAEAIICSMLETVAPDIPIIAEERVAAGNMPDFGRTYFLVDPLDGTKEFIAKRSDFTVNIALIVDDHPVVGLVYAPARGVMYFGGPSGAFRSEGFPHDGFSKTEKLNCFATEGPLIAVASRSHQSAATERFLTEMGITECVNAGSSLKFCLLAEGRAHIYPRFGRTMKWDTAAGEAVLLAAGGSVQWLARDEDEHNWLANSHFVAFGQAKLVPHANSALAKVF